MNRLFYFLLAAPFYIPGKIVEFVVWEIISTGRKKKIHFSHPVTNQEMSNYIQHLLKELNEEKKRADDLHDYYGRQLKQKDSEINPINRLN